MTNILLADIETSPIISYNWGLYEQNAIKKIESFTILSFAYKWLGRPVQVEACDTQSEKQLLLKLHRLLDICEIAVAHNGDSFDFKKINARFMVHKIPPPAPYRTIDTKSVAQRVAGFDSNSLNNLGIDLSEGEKIKHRGFDMWEGCMAGKKRDWEDMKRYNKKDVVLLEKIYIRLRPWMKNHPNLGVYEDDPCCPRCKSTKFHKRGYAFTNSGKHARYRCVPCGGWFRTAKKERLSSLVSL